MCAKQVNYIAMYFVYVAILYIRSYVCMYLCACVCIYVCTYDDVHTINSYACVCMYAYNVSNFVYVYLNFD